MNEALKKDCCVLNAGGAAWAFEELAFELSRSLGVDVSSGPRSFNYLLTFDEPDAISADRFFIPIQSIRLASDKRLLATAFQEHSVPIPLTRLFSSFEEVQRFVRAFPQYEWCLKYPTSCGASGHRLLDGENSEPANWPRPFIVQEFVRLEQPEVYRTFCAGGELFGWVARRFPESTQASPWVAHARGAQYVRLGDAPDTAMQAARKALISTGLWNSFGCVDLLPKSSEEWLVLEVGTDGLFNHVDRDLGFLGLEAELSHRIAQAFWSAASRHFQST
jgi:glutathione synthase/RimK-type ligase-like ATP-grasp enzyme